MQHRSPWTHSGDTWGLLGGAVSGMHDDTGSFIAENPVEAALREAHEEGGVPGDKLTVLTEFVDDHGGWSYVTVIGFAAQRWPVSPMNGESLAVEWVGLDDVDALPLHPGFGASWPTLKSLLANALDLGVR